MTKITLTVAGLTCIMMLGTLAAVASGDPIGPGDQPVPNAKQTSARSNGDNPAMRGNPGACCLPDGSCLDNSWSFECSQDYGGTFHAGLNCTQVTCVASPMWACCMPYGGCYELWENECMQANGTFHQGVTCAAAPCTPPCPPAGVFATMAFTLTVDCHPGAWWPITQESFDSVDLNGDGKAEFIRGGARTQRTPGGAGTFSIFYSRPAQLVVTGPTPASLEVTTLLDLHPTVMTYDGYVPGTDYSIICIGFFDVTDDGLADAIIAADAYSPNAQFFYVENISTPVVACVTDLNGDGETDIDDLLQVMGAWGPCL